MGLQGYRTRCFQRNDLIFRLIFPHKELRILLIFICKVGKGYHVETYDK